MDAKQINQNFDLVSYASELVGLRISGAYSIGPCPICGGRDRFQIKRTTHGDMWICRKCTPDKYHSAIDFFMSYHRLDFKQAFERMGGDVGSVQSRREPRNGKPVTAPAPVQVIPGKIWQADAWEQIDKANSRLMNEKEGEAGRRYLLGRGISRGAVFENLLGYAVVYKRPAILIPWLDVGSVVTAVKYRFIDDLAKNDKSKRFAMLGGSLPHLFGLQHILESDDALLFVEGELNAISVLQTLPRGVSVVSTGSQEIKSATFTLLNALVRHYRQVVIWTDDPDKARTIRERVNRRDARLLKSPVIDGVKWDANQMLQAGLLAEFISLQLSAECLGIPSLLPVQVTA